MKFTKVLLVAGLLSASSAFGFDWKSQAASPTGLEAAIITDLGAALVPGAELTAQEFTATMQFDNYCEINEIAGTAVASSPTQALAFQSGVGTGADAGSVWFANVPVKYSCTSVANSIAVGILERGEAGTTKKDFCTVAAQSAGSATCLAQDNGATIALAASGASTALTTAATFTAVNTAGTLASSVAVIDDATLAMGSDLIANVAIKVTMGGASVPRAGTPYSAKMYVTIFE